MNRFLSTACTLCFALIIGFSSHAQVWTWKSGVAGINQAGVYGTQGTASVTNIPGGRHGAFSSYDNNGNGWVFGGDGMASSGSGRLNDLWRYNIASGNWTWMKGNTTANGAGVYGTKGVASATVTPGARYTGASWTDASGNFWIFGGEGYDANGSFGYLNDLWMYNVSSNQWMWVSGGSTVNNPSTSGTLGTGAATNTPGARIHISGWADASGNLYMFGGYGYDVFSSVGAMNDLWKFNIASGTWTWLSGSSTVNAYANYGTKGVAANGNVPGARYGHAIWSDNSGNLWMFGGYGNNASSLGYMDDVWKYNPASGLWTWSGGSSSTNPVITYSIRGAASTTFSPGGRVYAVTYADANGNAHIIGGHNGGQLGDYWKYDISTGEFKLVRSGNYYATYGTKGVAATVNEPGNGHMRSGWKDGSGNLWLFGGYGYDQVTSNGYLNDLWQTSVPTTGPGANFNFNQSANVCVGSRLAAIDASSSNPVAWTYLLNGTIYSYTQNPHFQKLPTVTLSAGVHTITLFASNSYSISSITKTVNVSSSTMTPVYIAPSGSTNVSLGNGATPNSDWYPWVYTFNDPIPSGATLTRVDLSFYAVDQGWGGSGANLGCYLSGNMIANPQLSHSNQFFSYTHYGPFTGYQHGGVNNFSMYFVGWSGWQAFMTGGNMVLHYESSTVTVCSGKSVTLTSAGAATVNWSHGATEGVAHTPTATSIYTVTGTASNGCVSTATEAVIVNPTPTIAVTGSSAVCAGSSAMQTANVAGSAYSFSWSTGSTAMTISPTPTISTTYFASASHTPSGCSSKLPVKVVVKSAPQFRIARTDSNFCAGLTPTLASSQVSTAIAMNLAQSSDYVYVPHSGVMNFSTNVDVTFEAWIRCTASQDNFAGIISKGGTSGPWMQMVFYGNKLAGELSDGTTMIGTSQGLVGTTSLNDGNWHHVAFVVSRSTNNAKLYVDGAVEANVTHTLIGNNITSTYPLLIGCERTNVNYYDGVIDEVRVWGQAQSQSALQTNSAVCLNGTESNLLAYYSFENGPGSTVLEDKSVNDLHGVYINVNTSTLWSAGRPGCSNNFASFSWLPGASASISITPTPSVNSSYSLTVTGSNGCTNTAVTTLTVRPRPVISVTSGSICSGGTFVMIPSGANTYTVSGGSFSVSPPATSSYSVNGTNSVGCTALSAAVSTVVVNSYPVLSIAGQPSVCVGSSVIETGSGAASYLWNTGQTTASISASPSVTTTYTLTGVSAAGCSTVTTKMITAVPVPTISVAGGSICSGSSFTLLPAGAQTYTFSSGAAVVSPMSNTTYSVTGTNSLGCVSPVSSQATVLVKTTPTVVVNSGAICSGNSFTITPTGANSYTFINGQSVVSPLSTTSYSIMGVSADGCYAVSPGIGTVTVNALPVLSIGGSNSVCIGLSVTQTVTGASTYAWSNGSTSNIVSLNPATNTTYSVTGTIAATGCSASIGKMITAVPVPTISVSGGSICSGNSYTLVPSGAQTYTFSSGGSVVSPVANTTYSITGTNSLGCNSPVAAQATVIVKTTPTVSVNSGAICAGNSFTIVPGGASSYTYVNGQSIVSPASTTSYSIIGASADGCYAVLPGISTVTVNALPVLSISGGSVVCIGSSLSQTVNGASSYVWSNGATTSVISVSPNSTTNYSVTGVNAVTGCSSTVSKVIVAGSVPVISVNSGNICAGTVFTMTPTGASSYTYSSGSNTVSPSSNTSYSVYGTSNLGCVSAAPAIANVIVVPGPVINVNSGAVCVGQSFTIQPNGATTYTISGNSFVVSPTSTQTYSVMGTNAMGCVSAAPAISTVSVHAVPTIAAVNGTVCVGNSFTIVPTGVASSTVIGNSGNIVSPVANTTYSVIGSNAAGCVSSNTAVLTVSVISLPTISIADATVCAGSIYTLNPSGAASYTFSSGSATVIPLSNMVYYVTGSDIYGCVASSSAIANISVLQQPYVNVNSGMICHGESFTIVPSGAASYTITGNSYTVTPAVSTSYTITGSNTLGCVSPPAISNVNVLPTPTLAFTGNGPVCLGDPASINVSGANSYTWSTGAIGNVIAVAPTVTTVYTVQAASIDGCTGTETVALNVHPQSSITVNSGAICPTDSFVIIPAGASTYTISGGSATVAPVSSTVYIINGTDVNGCAAIAATASVNVVNSITISVSGTTLLCSGTQATLTANGGNNYTWSPGNSGPSFVITPTANISYSVVARSGACADSTVVHISVLQLPAVQASAQSPVICEGNSASIYASGASQYSWSEGSATSSINVTPTITTTYSVTGTSDEGCQNFASVTVSVDPCTGVAGHNMTENFVRVFPNPNSGIFTIESPAAASVILLDITGRTILSAELKAGATEIAGLLEQAHGVYFLRIQTGSTVQHVRIIRE